MQKPSLIAILFAALSLAGTARAQTSASTPIIETPTCSSTLSPYVCPSQEALLAQLSPDYRQAQDDNTLAPAPSAAKPGRHDGAAQPVPEPQTFAMILIGLVLLGFTSRRQEAYEKFSD